MKTRTTVLLVSEKDPSERSRSKVLRCKELDEKS